MSGPKTSQISIQEQIRLRLAAAESVISKARSNALVDLERLYDQIVSKGRTLKAMDRTQSAEAICSAANEKMIAVRAKLQEIVAQQAALGSLTSLDRIDDEANRIAAEVTALVKEAREEMRAYEQELDGSLRTVERTSQASEFAHLLNAAIFEVRKDQTEDAQTQATVALDDGQSALDLDEREPASKQPSTISWDEVSGSVENVTGRYVALMMHPEYLTPHNLNVLIKEGSLLHDALERCSESPTPSEVIAVSNHVNVMQELLPLFEREADTMREIRGRITALQAGNSSLSGSTIPVFSSLDEAQQFYDELKRYCSEDREQRYIQSCIDEVMRRHGYDIARSVSLAQSSCGENMLFGSESKNDGIHVFVSDQGDMMMEAVGVSDIEAIPGESQVMFEQCKNPDQAQRLLEVQETFCSVYAEIESELAEYGIQINTVNRCTPDIKYSKELNVQSDSGDAKTTNYSQARNNSGDSRQRRRRSVAKERAL